MLVRSVAMLCDRLFGEELAVCEGWDFLFFIFLFNVLVINAPKFFYTSDPFGRSSVVDMIK
jgi:hypothetical protein